MLCYSCKGRHARPSLASDQSELRPSFSSGSKTKESACAFLIGITGEGREAAFACLRIFKAEGMATCDSAFCFQGKDARPSTPWRRKRGKTPGLLPWPPKAISTFSTSATFADPLTKTHKHLDRFCFFCFCRPNPRGRTNVPISTLSTFSIFADQWGRKSEIIETFSPCSTFAGPGWRKNATI